MISNLSSGSSAWSNNPRLKQPVESHPSAYKSIDIDHFHFVFSDNLGLFGNNSRATIEIGAFFLIGAALWIVST